MFLLNEKKSKLLQPVANTSNTPLLTYPENGSKIASDSTIGNMTSVVKLALSVSFYARKIPAGTLDFFK